MNYCITHGLVTELPIGYEDLTCLVVSCPPPFTELSYEEVAQLVEPSEDELILMDMNAEVLLDDLGANDE
jgi:hypothetical protein